MSGVFIQMLMYEAEQQNTTLRADVNYMENYKALEEIKSFETLSLTGGTFDLARKKTAANSKLPTIGAAMMMNAHESAETAELRAENERTKKMMQALQEKLAQTLAGKSQLADRHEEASKGTEAQVEELRRKLEKIGEERDKAVEVCDNLRKEA